MSFESRKRVEKLWATAISVHTAVVRLQFGHPCTVIINRILAMSCWRNANNASLIRLSGLRSCGRFHRVLARNVQGQQTITAHRSATTNESIWRSCVNKPGQRITVFYASVKLDEEGITIRTIKAAVWSIKEIQQCCLIFDHPRKAAWYIILAPYVYPLPSARQHPSYDDCLEVEREYYQNCSVLGCVTQCSQSAAHSHEQFLQVQQIGFVTLGPLRHA